MQNGDHKSVLEQKLHQQQDILKSATDDAETIRRPHCRDLWEIAEERERAVIIDNTLQQTQQNIEKIKKALVKLEKNDFGICERCGDGISKDRLDVVPEAEFCQSCQEKS